MIFFLNMKTENLKFFSTKATFLETASKILLEHNANSKYAEIHFHCAAQEKLRSMEQLGVVAYSSENNIPIYSNFLSENAIEISWIPLNISRSVQSCPSHSLINIMFVYKRLRVDRKVV